MGQKLMLDDEVLRIINEHHENCDGSGYPRQLREPAIGLLSRLVCIANQFDNLCNPLNPRDGLSPHEALALMFKQQSARFDAVALKAFIRVMGVYPPGGLVQLDDQRYGLVLGINPSQPLKPTLIVYDAAVPKSEALIIDLAQEPRLSIAASLRPAQLPRAARGGGIPPPAQPPKSLRGAPAGPLPPAVFPDRLIQAPTALALGKTAA